jgi:transposase-like protein
MYFTSSTETRIRQRYSKGFKTKLITQAHQPDVSIAPVALSYWSNARLLYASGQYRLDVLKSLSSKAEGHQLDRHIFKRHLALVI